MRVSQYYLCHLSRWHFNFFQNTRWTWLSCVTSLTCTQSASINKCEFDRDALEYLGFIIGKNRVSMHPSKLATISNWPEPCSVKDIQCFLGLTNFYQCFISHYAAIAMLLYDLTWKDCPSLFSLTPDALSTFLSLKSAFQSTPVLVHHDPSKPIWLFTNMSDFTILGIPHQADSNNELHPLGFFHKSWMMQK